MIYIFDFGLIPIVLAANNDVTKITKFENVNPNSMRNRALCETWNVSAQGVLIEHTYLSPKVSLRSR